MPPGKPHPDQEAALELAEAANFTLQDWQEHVLAHSLLEKKPGKWASFENALVVPRQNGKTELSIARMLAGTLILGERLVVYTAHLAKTSEEVFRRTRDKVDEIDWIGREVKHIWRANGREAIEFRSGARILFQTRTPSSGRGFAKADCVFLDEAMYLPTATIASIIFILGRASNPQLWYLGSSPDQLTQPDSVALAAVRKRALAGGDGSLYYAEWSMPFDNPVDIPAEVLGDPEMWALSNPAYGAGLPHDQVANEFRATPEKRVFAIERGGVGDWPAVDGEGSIIDQKKWRACVDAGSHLVDPVMFSFDVSPDRAWASIAAAGWNEQDVAHIEVIEHRRGTEWLPGRLLELVEAHENNGVVCDAVGPGKSLLPKLKSLGVEVKTVSADEHAAACGMLFDAVEQDKLRHLSQPSLNQAVRGAVTRPLGERWAWTRRASSVDISPLVACTLALGGLGSIEKTEAWIGW